MNRINKNNYYYLFAFLFISLFINSCNNDVSENNKCKEYSNPYNLNIIYCIDTYKNDIKNNPDMELIDLEKSIKGIFLDIRYATSNNFTKEIIYTSQKAYTRKPVYQALQKVQDSLSHHNLALKIYDAYRPYSATVKFYEVYPDTNFVANPKYGSRHNRGCAVDLTLVDIKTGKEIAMPSEFDDFSEKAHPDYMKLSEEVIKNRDFLFSIMQHFGFTHYPTEWWHFDFNGWEKYPLMDISFENLEKQ